MAEQVKRETFKTPAAVAKWVTLDKPDTKFKAEGEYRVTILVAADSPLVAEINKHYDAAIEAIKQELLADPKRKAKVKGLKKADKPYKADVDGEGNETGNVKITFKAKASGVRKDGSPWKFRPFVFDAKKNPIPETTPVWAGSTLRVAYQAKPFFTDMVGAGLSLQLQAVQVLDLKTGSGKDAAAYGFEEEEGYAGTEAPAGDAAGAASGQDF